MTQFTVGCDPEFFVRPILPPKPLPKEKTAPLVENLYKSLKVDPAAGDSSTNVEDITPICGLLGGTKEYPLKIDALGDGYAVQEDGIAAEFNIPPCETAYEFGNALSNALSHIERAMLKPKGLMKTKLNNLTLKKEWIEKHPKINTVGCDPDFCAYEEKDGLPISRTLVSDTLAGVRGAGGHIHLGYPVDMCRPEVLTKLLDIVLGLQFLSSDKQGARRQWWGLAGLYRPKSYGVEYRTMSNWWIWNAVTAKTVAGNALALLESLPNHMIEWSAAYNAIDWEQVRRVINAEDGQAGLNLFDRYRRMFPIIDTVRTVGAEKAMWAPPERNQINLPNARVAVRGGIRPIRVPLDVNAPLEPFPINDGPLEEEL